MAADDGGASISYSWATSHIEISGMNLAASVIISVKAASVAAVIASSTHVGEYVAKSKGIIGTSRLGTMMINRFIHIPITTRTAAITTVLMMFLREKIKSKAGRAI